jgi:phytol kinase
MEKVMMDSNIVVDSSLIAGTRPLREEIRVELLRKSIHLLIALVPALASIHLGFTVALLTAGILTYTLCETLRINGVEVPLISRITSMASRRRDAGRFVLGPVTLGLGALLSLLLYPNPAASIAIYALAFGDGFSSLVGKLFGSYRMPFTGGKSIEGSLTCLAAVYLPALLITGDPARSFTVALVATLVEAIPTKDLDNIVLPVLTGAAAVLLF